MIRMCMNEWFVCVWMNDSYMNDSCHIWMMRMCMNVSCRTHDDSRWVQSASSHQICESSHTHGRSMSQVWMCHVAHTMTLGGFKVPLPTKLDVACPRDAAFILLDDQGKISQKSHNGQFCMVNLVMSWRLRNFNIICCMSRHVALIPLADQGEISQKSSSWSFNSVKVSSELAFEKFQHACCVSSRWSHTPWWSKTKFSKVLSMVIILHGQLSSLLIFQKFQHIRCVSSRCCPHTVRWAWYESCHELWVMSPFSLDAALIPLDNQSKNSQKSSPWSFSVVNLVAGWLMRMFNMYVAYFWWSRYESCHRLWVMSRTRSHVTN